MSPWHWPTFPTRADLARLLDQAEAIPEPTVEAFDAAEAEREAAEAFETWLDRERAIPAWVRDVLVGRGSFGAAARWYAELGHHITPIHLQTGLPNWDKRSLKRCSHASLAEFVWRERPSTPVGIELGAESRVMALTLASQKSEGGVDGLGAFRDLERQHGAASTWSQRAADGSRTLLYAWDDTCSFNGTHALGDGMKVLGEGMWIVLDPTPGANGHALPIDVRHLGQPAKMPAWLREKVAAKTAPRPVDTSSPFYSTAMPLLESGYSPIPIAPGSKAPSSVSYKGKAMGLKDWSRFCSSPASENQILVWEKGARVGIGVACGYRGLVAVDIDTDDFAVVAAINAALPETEFGKRGRKGETLFFYGPEVRSQAINLPGADGKPFRAIDILAHGKQTVLPPSVHPATGQPYTWTRDRSLDEVSPEDLPTLTPADIEALKTALAPLGYKAAPEPQRQSEPREPGEEAGPAAEINAWAISHYSAWVPALGLSRCDGPDHQGRYHAVPEWRASKKGTPFDKRGLNLSFHPEGIRDWGDEDGYISLTGGDAIHHGKYSPINVVMAARGCDLASAMRWLKERRDGAFEEVDVSGLAEQGERRAREAEAPAAPAVESEPLPQAEVLPDDEDDEEAASQSVTQDQHDIDLVSAPGLLGDTARFILSTMRAPTPAGALAAALAVQATLLGRKIMSETRAGPSLFINLLLPTGVGKEGPLEAMATLFRKVNKIELGAYGFNAGGLASEAALRETVCANPVCLLTKDECGNWLRKLNSPRASSQEAGILGLLRELFGKNVGATQDFNTIAAFASSPPSVVTPCLTLLGTSTPEQYFDALTDADVANGTLNRFFHLSETRIPSKVRPEGSLLDVPSGLIASLVSMSRWHHRGNMCFHADMRSRDEPPMPKTIPFASGVFDRWEAFEADMDKRAREAGEHGALFRRTALIALKIAMVASASEFAAPLDLSNAEDAQVEADWVGAEISSETMAWACRLALHSAEAMLTDCRKHMVQELAFGPLQGKILNILESAGRGGVKRYALNNRLRKSVKGRSSLSDAIDMLKDAKRVVEVSEQLATGAKLIVYKLAKFAPEPA